MAKVNAKEPEIFLLYSILQELERLMGRFSFKTIDEIESVIKKRDILRQEVYNFSMIHQGDVEKAKELWFTPSSIPKSKIAFLDKSSLYAQVAAADKAFTVDEIEIITYWLVK